MSDGKPIGAFRDANNDVSMGRIIAFVILCMGAIVVLNGVALLWVAFFVKAIHLTEPLEVIGLGVTLGGGSVGMKGWQSKLENQQAHTPAPPTAGN